MANAIEINKIHWSRNGEAEKAVEVCFKQYSTCTRIRIYDAMNHEWIEDTAQVVSITCGSTTIACNTSGYIEAVTKSGSTHRFTFDDFDRFKRVRDYIEEVICL